MTKRRRTVLALAAVAIAIPTTAVAVSTTSSRDTKAAAKPLRIMVTNDDGPGGAEYLTDLRDALCAAGHQVNVVIPSTDQSGNGTRFTARGTISAATSTFSCGTGQGTTYTVSTSSPANASPPDAVLFGLNVVYRDRAPDLVVSGINPGGNFGNITNHSGTVSAAVTAIEHRVPGIAVSIEHNAVDAGKGFAAEKAARPAVGTFVAKVIGHLEKGRGKGALIPGGGLNINWPIAYSGDTPLPGPKGVKITRIGTGDSIHLDYQPNSSGTYDIAAGICGAPTPCGGETRKHADTTAVNGNWISISPLDGDWSARPSSALSKRLRALLH